MLALRPPAANAGFTAHEVYRRMLELHFNQKGLAVAADLNVTYVRDILRGKSKNPKSQHLRKLATALGCEPSDLTDPGRPSGDKASGQLSDRVSEVAILEMWRILSPYGKQMAFRRVAELLPRADEPSVSAAPRKIKDV